MKIKNLLICVVLTVLVVAGVIGFTTLKDKYMNNKETSKKVVNASNEASTEVVTETETETETEIETEEIIDPVDVYLETVRFSNEDEYMNGLQQKYEKIKEEQSSDDLDETDNQDETDGTSDYDYSEMENESDTVESVESADGTGSYDVYDYDGLGGVSLEGATNDDDDYEPLGKERYDNLGEIDYTFSQLEETDEIVGEAGCLIDRDSLEIIYAKNAMQKRSPASTTKLLTALTVLEFLDLDEEVLVGKEQEYVAADASVCGVKEGQKYRVSDLMNGMLICSGNDAAYTLAYYAGLRAYDRMENGKIFEFNTNTSDGKYDPVCDDINVYAADKGEAKKYIKEFVKYMNKNAEELGCLNVNFRTPDGYDTKNQYVTAMDLARIGIMAKRNEVISSICATKSYYTSSFDVTWTSTNELMDEKSDFYNSAVDGLKTGSTGAAGRCFVASASGETSNLLSVVLGSDYYGRWNDTNHLIKKGFDYLQ